tara:strand:+ start:3013 stop:3174 length:162 start_codon:yes stop_codon:yes gene_type:complete
MSLFEGWEDWDHEYEDGYLDDLDESYDDYTDDSYDDYTSDDYEEIRVVKNSNS